MADSAPTDLSTTGDQARKSLEPEKASDHGAQTERSHSPSDNDEGKELEAEPAGNEAATDGGAVEKTVTRGTASSVEPVYPHGIALLTITIALMLTVLCIALDNTIIATAIPKITDEFNALDDVGWYASAYLLTNCTFQLLFGRIYTIFPLKWVFLIALGIFEIGSLVCGAAPNSVALIVGRAVAGFGAGGLFSGSLIIVSASVPLHKRPIFVGTISSMFGLASVVGPLMGGAFTDRVTWRLCFYINLPLGLITAIGIFIFFKSPPRHVPQPAGLWKRIAQFDPLGTLCFMPSIICLLLALQWGGTQYAWNSGRIIALFVLFGLLLIAFIVIQIKSGENATVPVRIVTASRTVPFAMFWCVSLGGSFFAFVYFVPIWFQAVHGVSATQSGINTLPFLLAQVVGSISSGIFVTMVGYYTPALYASTIFASIGAGLMTTWLPSTPEAHWIGYQILYGLGTGFGFQQAVIVIQTIMPNKDIPISTALVLFMQILGGSIFVSVGENVFTNKLLENLSSVLPPELLPKIASAGATAFYGIVPPKYLPAALLAYNGAVTKTFQVGLILSCLSIIGALGMEIKNVKTAKQKKGAAPIAPVQETAEEEKTETV